MIDLFETKLDLSKITCHSGGAEGADSIFESIGEKYGVKTKAYSYKTKYHKSPNKVEISDEDYEEGIQQIKKANKILNRFSIDKYMNLLARNWAQVKYSKQIFAIGHIVNPGEKTQKGYYCNSKYQSVDGGPGYCIAMSINNYRDIYVFDQVKDMWFRWSYTSMSFISLPDIPIIQVQDFAGVGTREILPNGIKAIGDVYSKTFIG
jgi:hypothetical protein